MALDRGGVGVDPEHLVAQLGELHGEGGPEAPEADHQDRVLRRQRLGGVGPSGTAGRTELSQ